MRAGVAMSLACLLLAGCASGRAKCERLAKRLMPAPTKEAIDACLWRLDDPEFVKAADCLLAVQGGVYEADVARCDPKKTMPLYFNF